MNETDKPYSALEVRRDLVTLVNIFTVAPGEQAPFAEAQMGEYRRLRGKVAGSLSANLHRAFDGQTLANVAQFRSMADYHAWVESELMREHGLVIRHLILRSEPGMYRVANVTTRTGDDVTFIETTETSGLFTQIVRLRVADEARGNVLAQIAAASPTLIRDVPGVASITVLDGQPISLAPPPTEGAPRGVVGDEKVTFQKPLVTIYIQLDERETADRLGAHALFAQNLTTAAAGVLEAYSHLFEVVFIQNDDTDKPARI